MEEALWDEAGEEGTSRIDDRSRVIGGCKPERLRGECAAAGASAQTRTVACAGG